MYVCYIRLCRRCPIPSPKSCLTSDNSYWGHWHYYQFKPHRQMQKSTFLEKAIHEIEMYNKNKLILLGSGDAYLYNKYILHFLDHFDSPCRCWRCFGLCPGLQIKLIFMEAAMLKWPAGNCKIHHAHSSSIAVLYDPCMYSSTLKLEERMKLHQWIKIQTKFLFKNLAKMKKSLVQ